MKRFFGIALFGALLFVLPTAVVAQGDPVAGEATGAAAGVDVMYKQKTEYDFEKDHVTGVLVKPIGDTLQGEQHGKTSSLIQTRGDFIAQMLTSVEDI